MSNIVTKVTVEVADATAKLAVHKARVTETAAALREAASAADAFDKATGKMSPELQKASQAAAQAKLEFGATAAEAKKAGVSITGIGHAAGGAHSGMAGIVRELRALGDEVSSGRTKQSPGTIMLLASKIYSMAPAAFVAVGAVAALAAGLGYLAVRAISSSNALSQMRLDALASGSNASIVQMQALINELLKLPAVSRSSAETLVQVFTKAGLSLQETTAASRIAAEQMAVQHESADKVATSMVSMLDPSKKATAVAQELAKTNHALTQTMVDQAKAADQHNDAAETFTVKLTMMAQPLAATRTEVQRYTTTTWDWIGAQLRMAAAANAVAHGALPVTAIYDEQTRQVQASTQAYKDNAAAAQASIDAIKSGPKQAPLVFDQPDVAGKMREQFSQIAAAWDGTQTGMLAKQMQVAQESLKLVQKESKEYASIEQEKNRLTVEYRRAAGEEVLAEAREQITRISAETQLGAIQQKQIEEALWKGLVGSHRLTANQHVEVQKELDKTILELDRQTAQQERELAQIKTQGTISLAKLETEAKKEALEEEHAAGKKNAAQYLQESRELAVQETAIEIRALAEQRAAAAVQPQEQARIDNQIAEANARLNLTLEKQNRQAALDANKDAKERVSAWKGVIDEIEGAESSFVSNILTKRKGLTQSLMQLGGQLIEKEISDDLKAVTTMIFQRQLGATTQKAIEQGGLLFHLGINAKETLDKGTQQAAQTSAVAAGQAAQTAAVAGGAAAQKGVQAAAGSSRVMADAAQAFSGTYASVSHIPVVGWIMAPVAAAAAFAAVAAYQGLASLDVGAWDVPSDMVANIHRGEMVVPATFAQGIRQSGGFGGDGGAGPGSVGDTHVHMSVHAFDGDNLHRWMHSPEGMASIASAFSKGRRMGHRL